MKQLPFGARLTLTFLLVIAIPLLGLTWFHVASFRHNLRETVLETVSAIADKKAGQIDSFVIERLADIRTYCLSLQVKLALRELNRAHARNGMTGIEAVEGKYRDALALLFTSHQEVGHYHDLLLIDTEGTVVFSLARESDFGTNLNTGPYNDSGLATAFRSAMWSFGADLSPFESYAPSQNMPAAFVVAPVFDEHGLLGAIALQLDLAAVIPVVSDRTGLGLSGETVLAEAYGDRYRYTAPLRHLSNATFNRQVAFDQLGLPMRRAVLGEFGVGVSRDYVGHEVAAAWRYIPSLHWGMVVKIDAQEAFAAAQRAEQLTWTASAAMLLIALLLTVLFSRKLSRPLATVSAAADRFAQGERNVQVPAIGAGEFVRLASAFNSMARQIEDYRTQLEAKVQARTEELANLSRLQNAIIDSADLSIISTTADGIITSFNRGAQRMLGYSPEEAIGKMTPESFHDKLEIEDRARQLSEELGIAVKPGFEVFVIRSRLQMNNVSEWTYVHRNGSHLSVDLAVTALWDDQGNISGYLGVATDITERKRSEQAVRLHRQQLERLVAERTSDLAASEQRYRMIADNVADLVWMLDMDLRFTYQSPSVQQMRGYSVEEALRQSLDDAVCGGSLTRAKSVIASLIAAGGATQIESLELELTCKDSPPIWTETTMSVVRGPQGQPQNILGVTRNITERKLVDRHREEARQEAERLAQLKTDFLANMSHEIRTPLNAVIGLAQIGLRDQNGQNGPGTFARILESGKHLLGVINDILDFSKIEAGKLTIDRHPFQIRATVADAVDMIAPRGHEKNLALNVEYDPDLPKWVLGDPLRLSQILANLLSNAVKFTHRGSIGIAVAKEGDTLIFRVNDTGVGMTPEQIRRLFVPFEQADSSTTRRFGGTGLGLAISQNLAGLMGGHIRVESRYGVGSSFVLDLPLPEAEELPPLESAPATGQARLTGLRVLAAEDVEVNRLVLEELLVAEGAHVVFAEDGLQALERLENDGIYAFHVVLMDVQMPVMDGYEATRQVNRLAPMLPVIGLTAHAMAEEHIRCRDAGMADIVTKPVDVDQLVAAIQRQWTATNPARNAPITNASRLDPRQNEVAQSDTGTAASPVIWKALYQRCLDRKPLVAKVVASVLETQSGSAEKLRQAAAAKDFETLAFMAHSLKGIAGMIEARELGDIAESLLYAAREQGAETPDWAERTAVALESVLQELSAHQATPPA